LLCYKIFLKTINSTKQSMQKHQPKLLICLEIHYYVTFYCNSFILFYLMSQTEH